MKRTMIAVLICTAVTANAAPQGSPEFETTPKRLEVPVIPPDQRNAGVPIKKELDAIVRKLGSTTQQAQDLVAQLRDMAAKKPEDVQKEIDLSTRTLSGITDTLSSNGSLAQRLQALRTAASVHRKRVAEMAKSMEEEDRTNILKAWDRVIQDADKAQASMTNMRAGMMDALNRLRMRMTAISEFMLAEEYQSAIDSLNRWIEELQHSVDDLRKALGTPTT